MPTPLGHLKTQNHNNLNLNPQLTEKPIGRTLGKIHPKTQSHNNQYLNPKLAKKPNPNTHTMEPPKDSYTTT